MMTIESTPEFVSSVYQRMDRTLAVVRKNLGRPMGLADKLLLSHLDDPSTTDLERGKSYIQLRPDRVILQDVLGQTAMLQFMQTRRTRTAVPTTHPLRPSDSGQSGGESDLRESLAENQEVYNFLRTAAAKYGVGFWGPGAGIIHQVALEQYAFPGEMIIGTDSHTPKAGGLGVLRRWRRRRGRGRGDGRLALGGALPQVHRRLPDRRDERLDRSQGRHPAAGGRADRLGRHQRHHRVLWSRAPAPSAPPARRPSPTWAPSWAPPPRSSRMTSAWRSTSRPPAGASWPGWPTSTFTSWRRTRKSRRIRRYFDRVVEIDLSKLEPHIVGPHSPDRARPISQLAAEVEDPSNQFVDEISTALIGSCTNSSYEDMSRSADVAEQARAHGIEAAVPFMVTPGSEQVRATIERDGQMASLKAIGGTVLANACGPCIGQWRRSQDEATKPNTIVTSYNRNFPMRNDGQPTTMNFIGSPEIVTAMALAGRLSFNPLTDTLTGADGKPFKLEPPKPAPEVPANNFDRGHSALRRAAGGWQRHRVAVSSHQ